MNLEIISKIFIWHSPSFDELMKEAHQQTQKQKTP